MGKKTDEQTVATATDADQNKTGESIPENSIPEKVEKPDGAAKRGLKVWIIPFIVVNLQRLWGLTWRRIDIGRDSFNEIHKSGKAWIYGIWPTNVLFSPYLNRGMKANVMISDSKDGEMITKVVRKFGNFVPNLWN